jgi:predicted aspartyl protease
VRKRILVWSVALACTPLLSVPYAQAQDRITGTFSFTQDRTGAHLVRCRLNDRLDVVMILDTGTGTMAISERIVKALGLTPIPAVDANGKPVLGTFPKTGQLRRVTLERLVVGGPEPFLKAPAYVWDTKTLDALTGKQVDGIIGLQVFGYTSLMFDFQKRQAKFWYPSTLTEEDLRTAGMEGAVAVPLDEPNMLVTVVAEFGGGKKETLVVDTGAVRTGISLSMARELGLVPRSRRETVTLAGKVKVAIAVVPEMTLGGLSLQNVEVEYPEAGQLEVPPSLGQDILSRYRVLIDVPNKKMLLKLVTPITPDKPDKSP